MRWNMTIDPLFVKLSRQLRKDQTPWEKKLWMYLKGRKFYGFKFRRQAVIEKYIYDFCCFKIKLIVELDGSEHQEKIIRQKDRDKENSAKTLGYNVIRFWNNDIDNNLEGVLEIIYKEVNSSATSSVTRLLL
jgi:very-short-patch-repair endonuclease